MSWHLQQSGSESASAHINGSMLTGELSSTAQSTWLRQLGGLHSHPPFIDQLQQSSKGACNLPSRALASHCIKINPLWLPLCSTP